MTRAALPKLEAQWPFDAKAKEILAKVAANPPAKRYVTGTFGPNDGELRYAGALTLQLQAIQHRYIEEALFEGDLTGNHDQANAEHAYTVAQAIDEAIEAAGEEEPEAVIRIRRHIATGKQLIKMGFAA